jgi:NAD(P) transhydrogenase
MNCTVAKIIPDEQENGPVQIFLSTGVQLACDLFLYTAGRAPATDGLSCEKAGVELGKRGIISVDKHYRTSQPHIFAAGDVIGFPSLASVSIDQGRVAVSRMFNLNDLPELAPELPFGIYTIPEVSMIGKTEEQATIDGLSACIGIAHYRNMPRGKIMGLKDGFLKLVFLHETTQIVGVHIIGQFASELIHYGITLVHNRKTLYDLLEAVFNFPTLHDLYKYAAYDGLGNLSGHKIKEQ